MGKILGNLGSSREGCTCGRQPGGILVVRLNVGLKQWDTSGLYTCGPKQIGIPLSVYPLESPV